MRPIVKAAILAGVLVSSLSASTPAVAGKPGIKSAARTPETGKPRKTRRVLLLGQSPDGHPATTHEYMPGLNVLIKCLGRTSGLQVVLIRADDPWEQGPEQILGADCVVLYLAEGAKWIAQDAARMAAFQELRARGGGLVCLHWAMGTRDAEYIEPFLTLFGGCHGGPDRKYKVVSVRATPTEQAHPVLGGIGPFDVHDEFYYALKFVKPAQRITPLISVPIDGSDYPVAWAFERKEGGRSFGFSGGHFHKNWKLPEYRRLAVQAVLWTLNLPIPEEGVSVEVSENDLKLFPRE